MTRKGKDGVNRRSFLRISALWTTAWALNVTPRRVHGGSSPVSDELDAIVIGSGLGGLSLAAYMARNDFKVLVLEHHDRPGGYATSFSRDSGRFTFDVSLHQMVVAGATEQILRDIGVLDKVRFVKPRSLFRFVTGDLDVTCPAADPEAFQRALIGKFPAEEKGIRGFFTDMVDLNREVEQFFREGKLTLMRKLVFPIRFPSMWAARKKSLADYVNTRVSDPRLRSVLTAFSGYYGLPPSELSGFYYMNATGGFYRHGGSYPVGGSQAISDAVAGFIESKGGRLEFNTTVQEILVENGRAAGVRTTDGKTYRAKAVVANCSAVRLFNTMVPSRAVPESFRQKMKSLEPSISSFVVWLGLKERVTDRIKDAHVFLCSELDPEKAWQHTLTCDAEKAGMSVCIYDNMDKGYSLSGTTTMAITMLSGYEVWKPFESDYLAGRKAAYLARKKHIAETLVARVERELVPGLTGIIAVQDAATPLTNLRYTLNTSGAIYGFAQSLDNSFMSRISDRTPIRGLYLASAWGEPGGGYTGVLISGRRAFGMLMEDWGRA